MKMHYTKRHKAKKLTELNPEAFWREIKTLNNCNTPLPSSIEGVSGGKEIVDIWCKKCCDLLNCVNNSSVEYVNMTVIRLMMKLWS